MNFETLDKNLVKRRCIEIAAKFPELSKGTSELVAKHELQKGEMLLDEAFKRLVEIEKRFDELDRECIRPSRALISGYGTEQDREKMKAINRESMTLRAEFRTLTGASA